MPAVCARGQTVCSAKTAVYVVGLAQCENVWSGIRSVGTGCIHIFFSFFWMDLQAGLYLLSWWNCGLPGNVLWLMWWSCLKKSAAMNFYNKERAFVPNSNIEGLLL